MGQDAWNLQYGRHKAAKYRRGTHVDMHKDEGFAGEKMIPGYAGAYKNSKSKVLKANSNPKSYGSESIKKSIQYSKENGEMEHKYIKRRK
jgi:hypothetical protein